MGNQFFAGQAQRPVDVVVCGVRGTTGVYSIKRLDLGNRVIWRCSCPSHVWRGACRHLDGFRTAVRAGYAPDPQVYRLTADGAELLRQAQARIPRPVMTVTAPTAAPRRKRAS